MNPLEMLKNLQKVQETMQQMQEKMKTVTAVGSAGGDMVKVTVNGQMDVLLVELAPECVDPRDIPMLADLIKMATNDALARVKDRLKDEMGPLGQNLGIPGLPGA